MTTKKKFTEQSSEAVMSFITNVDEVAKQDNSNIKIESNSEKGNDIKRQRINLFVDVDLFDPMTILIDKDRINITKYINKLIRTDVERRQDEIEKAKVFFSIK